MRKTLITYSYNLFCSTRPSEKQKNKRTFKKRYETLFDFLYSIESFSIYNAIFQLALHTIGAFPFFHFDRLNWKWWRDHFWLLYLYIFFFTYKKMKEKKFLCVCVKHFTWKWVVTQTKRWRGSFDLYIYIYIVMFLFTAGANEPDSIWSASALFSLAAQMML